MTMTQYRETNTLALASQAMQLLDFGGMLVKSGMLPSSVRSPESAVAIMVKGMELGLPAMAALNGITVIQGKPTVSPQLMLSLINRSGQLENIDIQTGKDGASVTMTRKGRSPFTAKFGPAEAKAMGLDSKDNYRKQAPVMYQWRAVAAAARVVFPDVIDGLYTPEEMGADVQLDEDGAMTVSAAPVVVQEPKQVPAAPAAQSIEAEAAEILGEVVTDPAEERMKTWGPKIATCRKRLGELGIPSAKVDEALSSIPNWRESDQNAKEAYESLVSWGQAIKRAQAEAAQPAAEDVKSDTPAEQPAPTATAGSMATTAQIGQLQAIAASAQATTSEARAALWGYMLGEVIKRPTKSLTEAEASLLIDTFAGLSPTDRVKAGQEAASAWEEGK